jgi:hypothetical protein
MTVNLQNDNVWLNEQGQILLEISAGNVGRHYFATNGAEVSPTVAPGFAARSVFINITGNELNLYEDLYHAPDGTTASTFVTYDNSSLPSWSQAIANYYNQLVYNAATLKFAPVALPSIFRHSNTYGVQQDDGHGNFVIEHFTNGRLDSAAYTYANGSFIADHFDKNGVLTYHQVGGNFGPRTVWQVNSDGTWTKQVISGKGDSSTILAAADASQQIANDAAAGWDSSGIAIKSVNGSLVLKEGDLLLINNFQYLIGHDSGSLIGQDAASLRSRQRQPHQRRWCGNVLAAGLGPDWPR